MPLNIKKLTKPIGQRVMPISRSKGNYYRGNSLQHLTEVSEFELAEH